MNTQRLVFWRGDAPYGSATTARTARESSCPRPTERGVRWSDKRDDGARGLQNLEGFLKRFARNGGQNGIVVPQHLLKFLLLVINDFIGPMLRTRSAFP